MQGRQTLGAVLLASFVLQLLALPAHFAAHHHDVGHHHDAGHEGLTHDHGAAADELARHAHSHGKRHGHEPHSALEHSLPALTPGAQGPSVGGSAPVALAPDAPTLLDPRNHVSAPSLTAEAHRPTGPPHPVGARAPPAC
jgi:hypothetical protein